MTNDEKRAKREVILAEIREFNKQLYSEQDPEHKKILRETIDILYSDLSKLNIEDQTNESNGFDGLQQINS